MRAQSFVKVISRECSGKTARGETSGTTVLRDGTEVPQDLLNNDEKKMILTKGQYLK